MSALEMTLLTQVGNSFEAKILAARLGADGILCQLRGTFDGPYPAGPTAVFVEHARLDEARALLRAANAGELRGEDGTDTA